MPLSCFDQETWICTVQYGIVLKGGGSSAPPPVDPTALANAQAQSNQQTAGFQANINNSNTTSPLGTSQWTFNPSTGQYSLNEALNPQTSALFGQQVSGVGNALTSGNNLLGGALANANNYLSSPGFGSALTGSWQVQQGIDPSTDQRLQSSFAGGGPIQNSVDTNFGRQVQQAQDAAYQSQTQYLDPQFSQARSDLSQQLADQGIGINNAAYDRATGNLGRQQQQAYQSAQNAAVAAGNQEQAQLFGESLGAGQFANQAQSQQFGQNLTGAQFYNQAQQQTEQQAIAQMQANNSAAAQAYQQQYSQPLSFAAQFGGLGLNSLNSPANLNWASAIPTYGGQNTTVAPTNVVGAQQVASQAGQNRFTDANTLNNQLFNGLGSLGSVVGGNGSGIPGLFGSGGLSGLFGGGAGLGIADSALPAALPAAAAWIICTELMKQGRLPKRHWIAGSSVFANYPERGKRGYYIWAIPTVRHLRKHPSSLYSRFIGTVFRWRAENIAAHKGVRGARKLWRGAVVTSVLYPACKVIGAFLPPIDWTAVYREVESSG